MEPLEPNDPTAQRAASEAEDREWPDADTGEGDPDALRFPGLYDPVDLDGRQSITSGTGRLTGALQVDGVDNVRLELRTADGRTVRVNLSRREFARLLAGGALSTVLPAEAVEIDHLKQVAKTLSEPHRAGPQVLRYFTVQLEQHFTADRMLGPRQLVGPVLAQIEVLERLRRQTRPGTTEAMLRLLAQYGEFAGWLHQDLGDINAAMDWSDRAVQWAQAAGDYQMVAYLLVRKSNIALLDDGQAETAVEILERKIAATPDHLRRDQGHQLVKLANALLATEQPDPERAAALGVECVATAETTGSARIVKELRALDQTLSRRWPTLPGTHEVHEALHAA
jgi:tetratricopeptide (TPR) repeat protein